MHGEQARFEFGRHSRKVEADSLRLLTQSGADSRKAYDYRHASGAVSVRPCHGKDSGCQGHKIKKIPQSLGLC